MLIPNKNKLLFTAFCLGLVLLSACTQKKSSSISAAVPASSPLVPETKLSAPVSALVTAPVSDPLTFVDKFVTTTSSDAGQVTMHVIAIAANNGQKTIDLATATCTFSDNNGNIIQTQQALMRPSRLLAKAKAYVEFSYTGSTTPAKAWVVFASSASRQPVAPLTVNQVQVIHNASKDQTEFTAVVLNPLSTPVTNPAVTFVGFDLNNHPICLSQASIADTASGKVLTSLAAQTSASASASCPSPNYHHYEVVGYQDTTTGK